MEVEERRDLEVEKIRGGVVTVNLRSRGRYGSESERK